MEEEIITSTSTVTTTTASVLNYAAITINPVMPTRSNGMGKIMIEILDVHLLTNKVLLRDWVIVQDETGKEIFKEILKDEYVKPYTDEQFSQLFILCNADLSDNTIVYRTLKEVADLAALVLNQVDPPYGLSPNSFEKYIPYYPNTNPTPVNNE